MKLRQKLAMVLAATMIVTAVPVVTMAKSTANITAGNTLVGTKGKVLTQAVTLQLTISNSVTTNETFYVGFEGAELTKSEGITVSGGTATADLEANEVAIKLNGNTNSTVKVTVTFPTNSIKLTADEANFVIDGHGSTVSDQKVLFATTSNAKATVSVPSTLPVIFTDSANTGAITIQEPFAGAFNSTKTQKIRLQLNNSDFDFTTTPALQLQRGLEGKESKVTCEFIADNLIEITIKPSTGTTTPGRIVITPNVKANVKAPKTGDLKVKVSGDVVTTAEYTVATIADYAASLKVTNNEEAVAITGGKKETVKFTLGENLTDSITRDREIEFTTDLGYFSKSSVEGLATKLSTEVQGLDAVKNEEKVTVGYKGFTYKATDAVADGEDFELELVTELTDEGDVTITASGKRAIGEDLQVVVATVAKPVTVKTEAAVLKAGLKDQKAGKITITETEAGNIEKGSIIITFDKKLSLDDVPTIEVVSGDLVLDLDNADVEEAVLTIPVKATSAEASVIEISELPFTTDRTIAEGTWDATLTVGNYNGEIELEDFIVIGTPNTEDLSSNGLRKGTAQFTIGSKEYTVNGETKTMDAAAYASNGRVMAPIRYVADAFGIAGNNILVTGNQITIIAGNRTIQLTVGSNIAKLNGVDIQMDGKVEVINGRSYAPLSQVGNLLGITPAWDGATQTATFTNK
jgi:hypothetical protein